MSVGTVLKRTFLSANTSITSKTTQLKERSRFRLRKANFRKRVFISHVMSVVTEVRESFNTNSVEGYLLLKSSQKMQLENTKSNLLWSSKSIFYCFQVSGKQPLRCSFTKDYIEITLQWENFLTFETSN